MTPSQKNEKALTALLSAERMLAENSADLDRFPDSEIGPDTKKSLAEVQEAIAALSHPTTGEMVSFEQIGWTWKIGSDPFLWTEFREMKDPSRQKAEELKAEAVYRKTDRSPVGGEVVTVDRIRMIVSSAMIDARKVQVFRGDESLGYDQLGDIASSAAQAIYAIIQSRVGGR